jgi:hypothetical protein
MKTTGLKIILLFLFCIFISAAFSQTNWKLARNESGIRVYQKDSKFSNFKSIRVECTLEGSFDKLISIINNISHYKDWVYNNKTTSLLKRVSAYEFYYYTEAYLPWPLDNRDAVMHTKISRDSSERFLQINSVAVPNYIPSKSGKVRIQRSDINWYVTRPSPNFIHIVYTFEADPGGSVPAWLVNSFADKGPFESFKKLGQLLKK